MVFLGLIRMYWLPETIVKIQAQSLSYFLLRKRNFHIRKLLKTLNSIFSKKKKRKKKNNTQVRFFPKTTCLCPFKLPHQKSIINRSKDHILLTVKKASKKQKAHFKISKGKKHLLTESFSVFASFGPFRQSLCPRILSKYADLESLCLYIV